MRLVVDKEKITAYCVVGDLPSSIEVDDATLPEGFVENFASGKYLYQDGKVVVNDSYEAPKPYVPKVGPSEGQTAIEQLGIQMASLTAENQKLKQANQAMGQTVSTLGMQVAQLLTKEQGGN